MPHPLEFSMDQLEQLDRIEEATMHLLQVLYRKPDYLRMPNEVPDDPTEDMNPYEIIDYLCNYLMQDDYPIYCPICIHPSDDEDDAFISDTFG